ncbi:unnamed protein product [Caenorhabditis nigoni]
MAQTDNNCNSMDTEMETEAAVLKEIQNKMAVKMATRIVPPTAEEQKEIDARSVFVGNVDFGSTIAEIEEHFKGCGVIVRTTIPKDKFTKRKKNFAYIEFESSESIENALVMNSVPSSSNRRQRQTNKYRGGQQTVVVKYIYVNGTAPRGRGEFRGRLNPY